MNTRTYLIPGFKNWAFKTSDTDCGLWSPDNGPGLTVTTDTPVQEISSHVENIFWLKFRMQGDEAKKAAKAIYAVDWQAMIREAGTDVQHQSPSLPGWTLRISDVSAGLWHSSGEGVPLIADTPMSEITESVRLVLQHSLPLVEINATVREIMRIDFKKLISNAWAPRAAPLLEGFTADNTALIESICADVRLLATLQKSDSTAIANEVCALLKTLA